MDGKTAVLCCKAVMKENSPVLLVAHDIEGGWQFLSGGVVLEQDVMVVSFDQVREKDPSIIEVLGIPPDHMATRKNKNAKWEIKMID